MKKNKACGPDCLPIEEANALGDEGAIWMTGVLNEAIKEGIPEEWRTSTITPISGSALGPLLFMITIDVITEKIDEGTPWAMLFADDMVLCDPDRNMMEVRQERWRECMEKKQQRRQIRLE